jgi:hypothetical protein
MFGRETDRFEVKSVSPQILNQASRKGGLVFSVPHSPPHSLPSLPPLLPPPPFIPILILILILKTSLLSYYLLRFRHPAHRNGK